MSTGPRVLPTDDPWPRSTPVALATGVTLLFAVVHYDLLDPGGATARW